MFLGLEKVRRLAVVAYPTYLTTIADAHFTLVFPTEVAEAPIVAQVRTALESSDRSGYYVFYWLRKGIPS